MREFAAQPHDAGWWRSIVGSKDPGHFVVLFEDSAALVGLVIAAAGVWASHYFGNPRIDGLASILIGLVLTGVALLLAREAKGLIIGESADPDVVLRVRAALENHPNITSVNHVRTIHTAPDAIFVAVSADFDDRIPMGEGERLIEQIEAQLKDISPAFSSIYIRPEKRQDAVVIAPD